MALANGFRNLLRSEFKRWVFLVVLVAITHLLFQSLPGHEDSVEGYGNVIIRVKSTSKSAMVRNPLTINASDMSTMDVVLFNNVVLKDGNGLKSNVDGDDGNASQKMGDPGEIENGSVSEGTNRVAVYRNDVDDEYENDEDLNEIAVLEDVIRDQDDYVNTIKDLASSSTMELASGAGNGFKIEQVVKHGQEVSTGKLKEDKMSEAAKELGAVNASSMANGTSNAGFRSTPLQSDHAASKNNLSMVAIPGKKKMRCEMPPKPVTTID